MKSTWKRYLAIVVVGLVTAIPVTIALADGDSGSAGGTESASAANSTSAADPDGLQQNRAAILAMQDEMDAIAARPRPEGQSQEAREAETEELMVEAATRAAEAAGGERLDPYPDGVVAYIPPDPLSELDEASHDRMCAEVAQDDPSDHLCLLTKLVQSGEIRSGYFTQEQVDDIVREHG